MIDIILDSNVKDIPLIHRTKMFQLHNRVRQSKLWDTNDRTNRELVLTDLRSFVDELKEILNMDASTLPAKYRNVIKYANNYFTTSKETGTSCSSCRKRIFQRLKTELEKYGKQDND